MGRKKKRMKLALRQALGNKTEVAAEELAPAPQVTPEPEPVPEPKAATKVKKQLRQKEVHRHLQKKL